MIDVRMRTSRTPPLSTIDAFMRSAHLAQRNGCNPGTVRCTVISLLERTHKGWGFTFMTFARDVYIPVMSGLKLMI